MPHLVLFWALAESGLKATRKPRCKTIAQDSRNFVNSQTLAAHQKLCRCLHSNLPRVAANANPVELLELSAYERQAHTKPATFFRWAEGETASSLLN
jgi:hypothetical protein